MRRKKESGEVGTSKRRNLTAEQIEHKRMMRAKRREKRRARRLGLDVPEIREESTPKRSGNLFYSEGMRTLFVSTNKAHASDFMHDPEKKRLFNKMSVVQKGKEYHVVSEAGQWDWGEIQRTTYPAAKGPVKNILTFRHPQKHDI